MSDEDTSEYTELPPEPSQRQQRKTSLLRRGASMTQQMTLDSLKVLQSLGAAVEEEDLEGNKEKIKDSSATTSNGCALETNGNKGQDEDEEDAKREEDSTPDRKKSPKRTKDQIDDNENEEKMKSKKLKVSEEEGDSS